MANIEHLDTFGKDTPALCEADVNLHFHALQWATGFQTLMPYLPRGAKNILLDDATFAPEEIVGAIVEKQATGMFMPTPMHPRSLKPIRPARMLAMP